MPAWFYEVQGAEAQGYPEPMCRARHLITHARCTFIRYYLKSPPHILVAQAFDKGP